MTSTTEQNKNPHRLEKTIIRSTVLFKDLTDYEKARVFEEIENQGLEVLKHNGGGLTIKGDSHVDMINEGKHNSLYIQEMIDSIKWSDADRAKRKERNRREYKKS